MLLFYSMHKAAVKRSIQLLPVFKNKENRYLPPPEQEHIPTFLIKRKKTGKSLIKVTGTFVQL